MKEKMVFAFNILVKKVDGLWVAHCLELDVVAAANSNEEVESDMIDLIMAQLNYALAHNNMKNFFHPAPEEVMREFNQCESHTKAERLVNPKKERDDPVKPPPYLLISNSSSCFNVCRA